MNKDEYWQTVNRRTDPVYKKVHKELEKWKKENNITIRCNVHHRDDNDEVRKYNELHYERWGCNEDGTFIEGKYVQFLTTSEHIRYHNSGKTLSEETKEKISAAEKGKTLSEETKEKMSENHSHYWKGKTRSDETKQKISATLKGKTPSEETKEKMSAANKANMKLVSDLWNLYKQLHPNYTMTFNEFQHSLKINKEG